MEGNGMYNESELFRWDTSIPPLQNYSSGPLPPSSQLPYPGAYLNNDQRQNMTLGILSNNTLSLSFPFHDRSVIAGFPLVAAIFDPSLSRHPLLCSYPFSGHYSASSRYFFYSSLLFSFVVRSHSALAIAALGSAMLYGATTAIHGLALLTTYEWTFPELWNSNSSEAFGDPDILPIVTILGISALFIMPILSWSISVRRHRAQTVAVLWGIIIVIALVPLTVYIIVPDGRQRLRDWKLNFIPSFALCSREGYCADPSLHLNQTEFDKCGCIHFCGTLSPRAPMRSGQQLVPWILSSDIYVTSRPLYYFSLVGTWISTIVVLHGICSLLQWQFSHTELRNLVFRILNVDLETCNIVVSIFGNWLGLNKKPSPEYIDHETGSGRQHRKLLRKLRISSLSKIAQYQIAKFVSATTYSFAVFFALLSPILFLMLIVQLELALSMYPHSEQFDNASAWSVWVSAILSSMAATILHLQDNASKRLEKFSKQGNLGQKRPTSWSNRIKRAVQASLNIVIAPLVHTWYVAIYLAAAIRMLFHEFKAWLHDPVRRSYDTYQESLSRWEQESPRCLCRFCDSADTTAGPADGNSDPVPAAEERTMGMRFVAFLEGKIREQRRLRTSQV